MANSITAQVKARALEFGFTAVGIAPAVPLGEEGARLQEWLARGYQGTMHWMERSTEKRIDPGEVLQGARSIIAVALNYYTDVPHPPGPGDAKISRYAWGDDYHDILGDRLRRFAAWLSEEYPGCSARPYVDTGPVMDKVWAARAGIGWEGKHTNVITRSHGSWVFLGEILTTLELEPDEPALDRCGTCTLCIEACPTDAIVGPYLVDSNLCLSYLTIEHHGAIEGEITEQFDGWVYGCDVCQDVCPWNLKFAFPSPEAGFAPRSGNEAPDLTAWQEMNQSEFSARFRKSPIKRTKLEGLLRNIRIVLAWRRNITNW